MENLKIHDWDEHQTYRKDRGQPPWIKVHRHIMRNIKWVALDDSERGQLVAIWLLAADHDGSIPASPSMVQKLCFMSSEPDLNKFIDLGFLESDGCHGDAKAAPVWRQSDQPKAKAETDKKTTAGSNEPAIGKQDYPDDFERAWGEYPKRSGDNPKRRALKAWGARRKQGHTPEVMIAGVRRYALWVKFTGKEGTELVKQAATFFGPDEFFLHDYAVAPAAQVDLPPGNDLEARMLLGRICSGLGLGVSEVEGKSCDQLRTLIRARHPGGDAAGKGFRLIQGGATA